MITIICPNCKKKHNIDKNRIPQNEKIIARCKACAHRFPIQFIDKVHEKIKKPMPEGNRAARSISVSISKGGVAKTTTAVNLSAGLALAGYKVLLVDTDTQGQDSYMLGINAKAGLTELLTNELSPEEAIVEARKNLWLLAGGKSLAGIKRLIDRKDFGGEMTLAEALTPLETQYDYIIIDTSPGWDPLTVNVLFYVKEILIPVSLDVMSVQGLVEFLKSLSSIQRYHNEVSLKYIVPTFHDKRIKHPTKILNKLKELYGEYICNPIRYNVNFPQAPAFGQTIFEFSPGCNGSQDYRELVRRVASDNGLFR